MDRYSAMTLSARTMALSLIGYPQRLSAATKGTGTITWTTSDATIATVSDGIVSPVDLGTVKVVARSGNISVTCLVTVTAPQTVSTLAGGGSPGGNNPGFVDGQGTSAGFYAPTQIVLAPNGNLYISDYSNGYVRVVTPAGAVSTPYPAATKTDNLIGMTVDAAGHLYWASNNPSTFVMYTDRTGAVTPLTIPSPTNNLRFGPDGHLYVAMGSTIRDFGTNPNGSSTPIDVRSSGSPLAFSNVTDMAWDSSGALFVTDTAGNVIWRIDPKTSPWTATEFVPDGTFSDPTDLVFAPNGDLYVTDTSNNYIRRVTPAGIVTKFVGGGVPGFADGVGSAAEFHNPCGIAIDPVRQRIYVSDQGNNVIRVIE